MCIMFFPHCCASLMVKRGAVQVQKNLQPPAKLEKPKFRGLRKTLRNLRDRLRTDPKTVVRFQHLAQHLSSFPHLSPFHTFSSHPTVLSCQTLACSDRVVKRRHLEHSDLLNFSMKDLNALSISLSQDIQGTRLHTVTTHYLRDS